MAAEDCRRILLAYPDWYAGETEILLLGRVGEFSSYRLRRVCANRYFDVALPSVRRNRVRIPFIAESGNPRQRSPNDRFLERHLDSIGWSTARKTHTAASRLPIELDVLFAGDGEQLIHEADDAASRVRECAFQS